MNQKTSKALKKLFSKQELPTVKRIWSGLNDKEKANLLKARYEHERSSDGSGFKQ